MIPLLSAVTPELAEDARGCVCLTRARKLAGWIGSGRQLTRSGVLKPALAVEACQALGIELPPGRLRSALDVGELMRDWEVACSAGYIVPGASRVRATGQLAGTSPGGVLRAWLRAASAELGLRDEPCAGCLTVLHELSVADGALGLARLAEAVRSVQLPADEDVPCPGCGEVHDARELTTLFGIDDDDLADGLEHAEGAVVVLMGYGAATALRLAPAVPDRPGEARVRLTPLGRMLAESVFSGCAPAADGDAAALIDVLSTVPPKIAAQMGAPWLSARSPAGAVRELLGYAESADATRRMVAMAFAMGAGPEAAPAWRDWAGRPGFGVYARMWLAERGEDVPEHPDDHAWMTVEALSAASAAIPAEFAPLVVGAALRHTDAGDGAAALSLMTGSGHPDATRFIESVTAATGLRAPFAIPGGDVYQLKITLRGVSKPPVWRRVTVPAAVTLEFLHDVIQQAMGWEDGHLHVFSTPSRDYGMPGSDLGHADERKATLDQVLGRPGATMRYTYDFGDGWEHDIMLEKILPVGPGTAVPSCLAGKGACPPEDCGGAWGYASLKEALADPDHEDHHDLLDWLGQDGVAGFDPAAFRLDEVNARLRQLA